MKIDRLHFPREPGLIESANYNLKLGILENPIAYCRMSCLRIAGFRESFAGIVRKSWFLQCSDSLVSKLNPIPVINVLSSLSNP